VTLHAVSLFSGIGLLDLGLHRAGIPTRLLCEADKAVPVFELVVRRLVAVDVSATPRRVAETGGITATVHGLTSRSHAEAGG